MQTLMTIMVGLGLWLGVGLEAMSRAMAAEPGVGGGAVSAEVKSATVEGQYDGERARLVFQAELGKVGEAKDRVLYATRFMQTTRVTQAMMRHTIQVRAEALQGSVRELVMSISGEGVIRQVKGEELEDWSVRQTGETNRVLVVRFKKSDKPRAVVMCGVEAETTLKTVPSTVPVLLLNAETPALGNGFVVMESDTEVEARVVASSGLIGMELKDLPGEVRPAAGLVEGSGRVLAFRLQGAPGLLTVGVELGDPEARRVALAEFGLTGTLEEDQASFVLNAVARVRNPRGGKLELLRGVALSEIETLGAGRMRVNDGRFVVEFEKAGEFPIRLRFSAVVKPSEGWNEVAFGVAPSPLQPMILKGLKADTQFRFEGGTRPERRGEEFVAHVPAGGDVRLGWRDSKREVEGRLFYAAKAVSFISVSPGLLRQAMAVDLKVMQNELSRVVFRVRGTGEVTRVLGPKVLSWKVEDEVSGAGRRLVVQFNEPQKDQVSVVVQFQQALGSFPQAIEPARIEPEGATRYGGFVRVVNEGAVRLEVVQSTGLSQVSPDQVSKHELLKGLESVQSSQQFAYRFSQAEHQLRIQADNVIPEIGVSQVVVYHLGENEQTLDVDVELDIREAPIRELGLRVPKGYVVSSLNAVGMADYTLVDGGDSGDSQLRITYGAPVVGRQLVNARLERNKPLGEARWVLGRFEVLRAKSVRGHLGVTADAGYRVAPAVTSGLTEVTGAMFPKRVAGLQAAFRLNEPAWQLTLNVERLPQSIQADVFHLFSVGEGIAYGSSLMTYVVTGAPVAMFKVELSGEYFNVEFTGKNIRAWQKTGTTYVVQLHTPVTGSYSLLATYERPFKPQGETLGFAGAQPLDATPELGHTAVISAHQFRVQPVNVSSNLTLLEPGELPAEYRLLFDAPILASYRYSTRPFNLQLELKPMATSQMLSQVVDRAALVSKISGEGQLVTEARYFVKSKGSPHLRVGLSEGTELWSVTVNGNAVVPVKDAGVNLIPLPQQSDPDLVSDVRVKIASKMVNPTRFTTRAPVVFAPVLLAEWSLEPESGRRLIYRGGTLPSPGTEFRASGFGGLWSMLFGPQSGSSRLAVVVGCGALGMLVLGAYLGRSSGAARWTLRHVAGGLVVLLALGVGMMALGELMRAAQAQTGGIPAKLSFLVPVQKAGNALTLDLSNVRETTSVIDRFWGCWPCLGAVIIWVLGWSKPGTIWRSVAPALGWMVAFSGTLRMSGGATAFVLTLSLFLLIHVIIPSLRHWWAAPQTPDEGPSAGASSPSSAMGLVLLLAFGLGGVAETRAAQPVGQVVAPVVGGRQPIVERPDTAPQAESVVHQIRVEDEFVVGQARVRWQATKGQTLEVLRDPAVLTRLEAAAGEVRLIRSGAGEGRGRHLLISEKTGMIEVTLHYQTRVQARDGDRGFVLPSRQGLVNKASITVTGLNVDLVSPQAMSVLRQSEAAAVDTVSTLVLMPTSEVWIGWKPRSRDVRRETAVYYAEWAQVYIPAPGVVEGLHSIQVRPAQGELSELVFEIPTGATITDVMASALSVWRFDPDSRRLRVGLNPAQSKPFSIVIKSQSATGPLPFERAVGLVNVVGAAGEVGLVGVATGAEVQLDSVTTKGLTPINLEDFPVDVLSSVGSTIPGLGVRRVFRYSDSKGELQMKAVAVESDVRVESVQTLSLGEDRILLAATMGVEVTRAGIFKLSFVLPSKLDIESVSGAAMSHWTELKSGEERVITIHLKGRSEGRLQFAITLAGAGMKSAKGWGVPNLAFREASKQRGQLTIMPEQGMRPQVVVREGVTQVDPLKTGVRQKGALVFGLLQKDWRLTLDLEQVDSWIQATSLQHVEVGEAQLKVLANVQYEIENTGVKALRVKLPATAEGVRFRGDQVADFAATNAVAGSAVRDWEVKLQRRIIGRYLLQLSYTLPLSEAATNSVITGVQASDVSLQRGFLTIRTAGRRQARVESIPVTLQLTDWQVIPRGLQADIPVATANQAFRLVEANFSLPLRLERHEAARMLPARVSGVELTSVIADNAEMLTRVRVKLSAGEKRLLPVKLPEGGRFWFAFVNQGSATVWQDADQVLIPLEQPSKAEALTEVEFFFSGSAGIARGANLVLDLNGPRFDLPLENIQWRVFLGERWTVTKTSGAFVLRSKRAGVGYGVGDLDSYSRNEQVLRMSKTKEAEGWITMANGALVSGDPTQARRAFQNAYGLSQHDNAFNEDARVQLQNLKTQQALVGLNALQARVGNEADAMAATPKALREGQKLAYTQQEARMLLGRNGAEDNSVQVRLVERLIQQQDAAVASPAAIRATVPEAGTAMEFTRGLEVTPWAELKIGVRASAEQPLKKSAKLLFFAIFPFTVGLPWLIGRLRGAGDRRK